MKSKICKVCLRSDILCAGCNEKIKSGDINEKEINLIRALYKVCGEECEIIKSAEDIEFLVIVADRAHMRNIIGKGGKNTKKLSEIFGKKVRIIEKADERSMIESLLGYKIMGVNIVYAAENFYKIRIENALRRRIRHDYSNILSQILGKKVQIVFE